MEKLLKKSFVGELMRDGTYSEAVFQREYESVWQGDSENSYFSADVIDKHRQLQFAELEYKKGRSDTAYHVIGVDVGRKNDLTEIVVIKVTPQNNGASLKSIVNLYSLENMHFEMQALKIKEIYYRFNAKAIVLDANGLGIGLVDFMVKPQHNKDSGIQYPDFGVMNDKDGTYKGFRTEDTELDAMYLIKANAQINTEAFANMQAQLSSGKIKFLVSEVVAKQKLQDTKKGQKMSAEEKIEYLRPYVMTSILREQLLNLVEQSDGANIILKQQSKKTKKDKFSATAYALYFIKKEDDKRGRKGKRSMKDFMFFN